MRPIWPGRARALRVLREVFHAQDFRPGQEAAVRTALQGRDMLCLFPTGAGKSLCYQLPALLQERPVLVISPLIALMRDQTAHLAALGIAAACLDSMQDAAVFDEQLRRIEDGEVRLIYVSPERLRSERFLRALVQHPPALAVVDEAHCVVQWGKDFRPAYLEIPSFIGRLPWRPAICAMTATADAELQRQIVAVLGMRAPKRIVLPLTRDNLVFHQIYTLDPGREAERISRCGERGLIFCRTRKRTELLARYLSLRGVSAGYYHAGMPREARDDMQARFVRGEVRVLAATSAFGMGVDIPDIRFVVMDSLPANLMDLIQQAGRAGRDGQDAQVYLLLSPQDLAWKFRMLRHEETYSRVGHGDRAQTEAHERELRRVLTFCLSGQCASAATAAAFGQRARPCGRCDACLCAAKHHGRFRRVIAVPKLGDMPDSDFYAWLLMIYARVLREAVHLPRWGFGWMRALSAGRSGRVHCGKRWRGVPQERLQAVLNEAYLPRKDT